MFLPIHLAVFSLDVYVHTAWHEILHEIKFYGFTVGGRTVNLKSVNYTQKQVYYCEVQVCMAPVLKLTIGIT